MADEFYSLSDKDTWQTPEQIIDQLSEHLDIRLDPCAGLFTFIGEQNWTIEVPDDTPNGVSAVEDNVYENEGGRRLECGRDSLERDWDTGGLAFVNPPFSMKNDFIDKTIAEYEAGNIDAAIVLTPDSTDVQSWWHEQLGGTDTPFVWFSKGRISFVDPDTGERADNPTFGTALHFIGPRDYWSTELFDALSERGEVDVRWEYVQ
jgi:hypothetical protein